MSNCSKKYFVDFILWMWLLAVGFSGGAESAPGWLGVSAKINLKVPAVVIL